MHWGWVLSAAVFLQACSTITTGTTQAVAIQTPGVERADCELKSEGIGVKTVVSPATIVLDKSQHNVEVRCRKKCFTDGVGIINSMTEEMVAGNLIVGGVVGLAVDAGSGAMNKYDPQVQIAMSPIKSCKA